jgi:diguanylate cyclase (GGDEF)-like protein
LITTMRPDDPRLESLRQAARSRGPKDWAEGAFPLAADGVRALAVPLRAESDVAVAALVLLDPVQEVAATLTELPNVIRPAVANAMQVRAIRELTIKDDTASCYNRRYFEEFILEEMSRANRFKTPMSLIFFDMDNLKDVNTRLGHAAGSRTLLEVSERVRGKIRKFDKLFRFGGDEFCIVLPETEWHGATEVAERVRDVISSRPFLAATRGAQGAQPMTASFGIASFPLHARTKEELVQRADRAMQSVKTTTKNGIATAERRRDPDAS